jgi:hypothetical protein
MHNEMVSVTFDIEKDLKIRFQEKADSHRRSMSAQICMLIERFLEDDK